MSCALAASFWRIDRRGSGAGCFAGFSKAQNAM